MNELSQFLLPTLQQGDMITLMLKSGAITGKVEEYREDVQAIKISNAQFAGVYLPFIITISTYLILELAKM